MGETIPYIYRGTFRHSWATTFQPASDHLPALLYDHLPGVRKVICKLEVENIPRNVGELLPKMAGSEHKKWLEVGKRDQ